MELINTEAAMNMFGQLFVDELKSQLNSLGKGGGPLEDSIGYNLRQDGNGFYLEITSESYLLNVDEGRRPGGKFPPVDQIRDWAEAKGIRIGTLDQTAYVIGRAIAQHGIEPTDVIETALNVAWDGVSNYFSDAVAQDFSDYIDMIRDSVIQNNNI
jgi:hypothetical protein